MSDEQCCTRILIDTGKISGSVDVEVCRLRGEHDWIYSGEVCCQGDAKAWQQRCHCGSTRWTDPPNRSLPSEPGDAWPTITAERIREMWTVVESIRAAARRAESLPRLISTRTRPFE